MTCKSPTVEGLEIAREKECRFIGRMKMLLPFWWKYYSELVAHELMSRDELAEYNFKRRVEMVRYAYENTVFYHP